MRRHAERIKRNIIEAEKRGWKLAPGCWIDDVHGECCPLGATFIVEGLRPPSSHYDMYSSDYEDLAVSLFDERPEIIEAFFMGFDGDAVAYDDPILLDAYNFGKELSTF